MKSKAAAKEKDDVDALLEEQEKISARIEIDLTADDDSNATEAVETPIMIGVSHHDINEASDSRRNKRTKINPGDGMQKNKKKEILEIEEKKRQNELKLGGKNVSNGNKSSRLSMSVDNISHGSRSKFLVDDDDDDVASLKSKSRNRQSCKTTVKTASINVKPVNFNSSGKMSKRHIKQKVPEIIDLADDSDNDCGTNGDEKKFITETFLVSKIYLGKKGFGNLSSGNEIAIEVSSKGMSFYSKTPIAQKEMGVKYEHNNILFSRILLKINQIKEICTSSFDDMHGGSEPYYVAVEVNSQNIFKNSALTNEVNTGKSKTFDPLMSKNEPDCPAKYILIVLQGEKSIDTFVHMKSILESFSKQNDIIFKDIHFEHCFVHEANSDLKKLWSEDLINNARDNRSAKRSRGKKMIPIGEQDGDANTYLIYPIEEDSKDAVHITYGDIRRLEPPEYLNDQLIDFKIKHMLKEVYERTKSEDSVHAFNCLFYPKLTQERVVKKGYQLVQRWTKNVDIFQKEMIIIPINHSTHWSVLFILYPNLLFTDENVVDHHSSSVEFSCEEEKLKLDNAINKKVPCILSFDSLSIHNSKTLVDRIRQYLILEYLNKKCNGESSKKEKINGIINKMKHVQMKEIPTQENGYDCGVYVCKYIEVMLRECIESTKELIDDNFRSLFKPDHNDFTAHHATLERVEMKKVLSTQKELYDNYRISITDMFSRETEKTTEIIKDESIIKDEYSTLHS